MSPQSRCRQTELRVEEEALEFDDEGSVSGRVSGSRALLLSVTRAEVSE